MSNPFSQSGGRGFKFHRDGSKLTRGTGGTGYRHGGEDREGVGGQTRHRRSKRERGGRTRSSLPLSGGRGVYIAIVTCFGIWVWRSPYTTRDWFITPFPTVPHRPHSCARRASRRVGDTFHNGKHSKLSRPTENNNVIRLSVTKCLLHSERHTNPPRGVGKERFTPRLSPDGK